MHCMASMLGGAYNAAVHPVVVVCVATFVNVPEVEFDQQVNNSKIIVPGGCTTCPKTDACAALPIAQWCERRCQLERTCMGFYVSDDGICCPVESRPQVTAPLQRTVFTSPRTRMHTCHHRSQGCETKMCNYYERKGAVQRLLFSLAPPFAFCVTMPGSESITCPPSPQTCRAIWMVRNAYSCTAISCPGRVCK